ncbi:hypothetical protein AB0D08_07610 [Kitasatospora sp. NPDC048540]|uniref:hypothetical protein n=1 Tax=Kitasatospora sp. NPDC048540 TaxID=3155634 RepID=UPI0033ED26C0
MDHGSPNYCVPCRRHLNGAFSCPGCGAPASDFVPLPAAAPEAALRPAGRARRRTGRGRRIVLITAAGLVIGGAGVVALAAPQDDGAARPGSAPTEEHQAPVMPSLSPVAVSAPPSPSATARASRSARPSASASASTAPATASRGPVSPTAPAPAPTSAAPTGQTPTTPAPSPTRTCKPILFWCS